jgi:putative ABC transport system permease protein
VTGVMEDIPDLSKFKFDFLITPTDQLDVENPWRAPECTTYVLLNENTRGDVLTNKLTRALEGVQQLRSTNRNLVASLTPITEARLSTTEYLIGTVGILIMFICWINYINQIIAQSYWRMKETGILRVMGANKLNLIWQFVIESTLTCFFSLVAIIITYLSLERFLMSRLSNHLLPLFGDHTYINFIFAMIFVGGIITAAALSTAILFSQDFGKVLQNVNRTRIGGINIRRALVVLQFSISSILVICIFVIQNQLEFLERADKGINMQDILVVKAPIVNEDTTWNLTRTKLKLFKAKCLELPFVSEVSSSTTVPSDQYRNETYLSLQNEKDKFLVHQSGVDTGFFRLYNAEFIAGHDFVPHASFKNSRSIILNESAARGLGIYPFEQAVDTHIIDHESNKVYGVIGIIKDFHQTPLKYKLEPMAFKFNVARGHISMKIVQAGTIANNIDFKIKEINKAWKQVYGDTFFDYFFPGEKYEAQNLEDRYFGAIFGCFPFTNNFLFRSIWHVALDFYERTKGDRHPKVFGASTSEITFIFLREYLGPLTISIAIGTPIGLYLMTIWLSSYAERIAIGPGLISMAVVSLIIVFLFTISFHTVKAAMTNPVSILRE